MKSIDDIKFLICIEKKYFIRFNLKVSGKGDKLAYVQFNDSRVEEVNGAIVFYFLMS